MIPARPPPPPASPPGKIKTGKASLVGGVAVGVTAFVLWMVITRELGLEGAAWLIGGLIVAVAIGAWIRVADL
jgi:hypothetical protein